jgi:hypothetical protein
MLSPLEGAPNDLRSADDEPGSNDKEQEESDVDASENVHPFSSGRNGNFAGENGTNEHRKQCTTLRKEPQVERYSAKLV